MLNALHEENQELKGEIGKILEVNEDFLEEKRQWEKMSDAFAELYEEYQKLRKALKKEYMSMSGVLCDACKHQEATYTNNWFVGEDFDVKCNKGYEVLIDDDEQECDDFELRIGDVE